MFAFVLHAEYQALGTKKFTCNLTSHSMAYKPSVHMCVACTSDAFFVYVARDGAPLKSQMSAYTHPSLTQSIMSGCCSSKSLLLTRQQAAPSSVCLMYAEFCVIIESNYCRKHIVLFPTDGWTCEH